MYVVWLYVHSHERMPYNYSLVGVPFLIFIIHDHFFFHAINGSSSEKKKCLIEIFGREGT